MTLREFKDGEAIEPGALIELDLDGRKSFYFLVAEGGGFSVSAGGQKILVITPKAPLGEALLGRRAGEGVEVEVQKALREYEVVSIV
jgi:transcription elongation GreA/GreB family factor